MSLAKKRILFLFIIIPIFLVASAVGIYFLYDEFSAAKVVKPKIGPVVEAVYGLGTVIAPNTFQVKTAINQNIEKIYVKEGDQVKSGDPLIKFDESGATQAPFAGTITSVPFKQGELLSPSMAAVILVNLQNLYLEVSLEQQSVLRVASGQKALVSFESIRSEKLEGKVESVFPKDSQFIVRISLKKFPNGVLPGMTADVAIEVGRKENVLTIPLVALAGGKVSFRRNGKTMKETVQVGVTDGEWAEITSDNIKVDDEIFVRSK